MWHIDEIKIRSFFPIRRVVIDFAFHESDPFGFHSADIGGHFLNEGFHVILNEIDFTSIDLVKVVRFQQHRVARFINIPDPILLPDTITTR